MHKDLECCHCNVYSGPNKPLGLFQEKGAPGSRRQRLIKFLGVGVQCYLICSLMVPFN